MTDVTEDEKQRLQIGLYRPYTTEVVSGVAIGCARECTRAHRSEGGRADR